MEHSQQQGNLNNNPTAIWQGRWAQKLDDILFHFSSWNTTGAWNALVDFKTILPPDVEEDVQSLFDETDKLVHKVLICSPLQYYQQVQLQNYRNYTVLPAERKLLTAIKKSLFDRGWINKDFSVGPRSSRTARIE